MDSHAASRYAAVFVAVCRAGSMTGAARAMSLTQPAVTYQIRRLEEVFGARLFERSGRHVRPTAAARRLQDLWDRQAGELQSLHAQLVSGLSAPPADVRIAAVSGFGRHVLYPRLRPLVTAADVHLTLLYRTADEVMQMVETGHADCGVVYHAKVTSRLLFSPLYAEELVLITSARMRPPRGGWRSLRSYAELPLVAYEESDYVFGRWFRTNFRRPPRLAKPTCIFSELDETVDAVARGAGVSIVPREAVGRMRGLRIIRPTGQKCFNEVFQVIRPGSVLPASLARVLADFRRSSPDAV